MARLPLSELKAKFITGKTPTQQDYYDVLDSLVHLDNQTAVDVQVVNTRLSTYDAALKARQPDGNVNTLGDLFYSFVGYDDARNINNELKWSGLPGKPSFINLAWTEQTITTDESAYNPLGSVGSAGSGPSQRWLLGTVGALTGSFLIVDVKTDRRWVSTGGETGFYADRMIAVKVAITPKTNL